MVENFAKISPEGVGVAYIDVIYQDVKVFRPYKEGIAIKILTTDTSCLLDDWPTEDRDSDGFLKIDINKVSFNIKEKKLKIEVDEKVVGALNLNQAPRYKLYIKIGNENVCSEIQVDLVVDDNLYTTFAIDSKLLEKKQKEKEAELARQKEEEEAKARAEKEQQERLIREEQEKLERERREKERREKEELERAQREKDRLERERLERERREKEEADAKERAQKEAKERHIKEEQEKIARQKEEEEAKARAQKEAEDRLKEEQERLAHENLQKENDAKVNNNASFATEDTSIPSDKTVVNINNNKESSKSNKMLFIILAIILLLVLGAVAYFFLLGDKDKEKDACSLDNNNLQSVLTACNYQKGDSNDKLVDLALQGAKDGNNCDNVNRILISLGRSGDVRAAKSLAHFFDENKEDTSKCFVKDKENAKYWYQKVIDLDSNNEDAKKALDEVSK